MKIIYKFKSKLYLKYLSFPFDKNYDHEMPEENINNFIKYVGITWEQFDEVIKIYYTQSPNI
ncbi:hypothetical protein OAN14_04300 [Candidatus Pelagibacter sp.]|nr:hypothetical protein [Candidatus Pelagibacter sp.]